MTAILAVLSVIAAGLASSLANASGLYRETDLRREAARLERAVTRIFKLGIAPVLKPEERAALSNVEFKFPPPEPDDPFLNFYAGHLAGRPTVVLPLQSLRLLEDLTTAFAWLYHQRRDFGPLDLYFAMLQRKPLDDFGPPGKRDLLSVLAVPPRVWETDKAVDTLSLSLRNEAFAFILAHELGHLRFRHGAVRDRGPAGARADEVEADAFALDVLARTGTPPMGAVIFFQAQIYSLPHRGDFKSSKDWQTYLQTASTHPLSVDRIRAMARMINSPLARRRPNERATWQDIARRLTSLVSLLADVELHNCIARVALDAPVRLLREPRGSDASAMQRYCTAR